MMKRPVPPDSAHSPAPPDPLRSAGPAEPSEAGSMRADGLGAGSLGANGSAASTWVGSPSAAMESAAGESVANEPPFVVVRDVSRVYTVGESQVVALQQIQLEIARGEFVCLVGVSGSGKSTLLHLLGTLDRPNRGSIQVGGQELTRLTPHEMTLYRRQMLGVVFQSYYLLPHLTALANVTAALGFQGVWGKAARAQAAEMLEVVGLGQRLHHRPGQLSGGQQQRVALARALVHRPRLLLADEPTANLDRKTSQGLLELMRNLQRERGTTVIMATHDRELADAYSDRQIELCDGQVVGSEIHQQEQLPS